MKIKQMVYEKLRNGQLTFAKIINNFSQQGMLIRSLQWLGFKSNFYKSNFSLYNFYRDHFYCKSSSKNS